MLVVSLALISSRLDFLPRVLQSIGRQSAKPDKILIHYSRTPFHLDFGFSVPPNLGTDGNVELIEVPNDGSCRKYLHTIQKYRDTDTTVILVDDDIYWREDVFERLVNHVDDGHVATTRGWSNFQITRMCGIGLFHRGEPIEAHRIAAPTEVRCASSGWATAFRADQVDERFFDERLRQSLFLEYSDEVYLSHMLRPQKHVVPLDYGFFEKAYAPFNLCRSPETAIAKAKQIEILGWN